MKMQKLSDKKKISRLIFLCAAAYFISYLTRKDYSAILTAYIQATGVTKADAALPETCLFITYGIGQLVSGWFGDRIPPRHIISCGFILTSLMNFTMTLVSDPQLLMIVWGVNGFAQAMMWPPLVRIMTDAFDDETYVRACVTVCNGSSIATIAVYLIAPVFVSNWKGIFYVCGAGAFVMIFVWNIFMNQMERDGVPTGRRRKTEEAPAAASSGNGTKAVFRALGPVFLCIMLSISCQGMIRDGITSWMPTYIEETFHIGTAVSILTGVLLPLFAIVCYAVTRWLCKKVFPNELVSAGVLSGACFCAALLLSFIRDWNAIVSVALITIIVGTMHGVNLIQTTFLPGTFKKCGNVSFISGLLNFCTYIGSATSTYGMARISDMYGWTAVIVSWAIVAALTGLLCLSGAKKWDTFKNLK